VHDRGLIRHPSAVRHQALLNGSLIILKDTPLTLFRQRANHRRAGHAELPAGLKFSNHYVGAALDLRRGQGGESNQGAVRVR